MLCSQCAIIVGLCVLASSDAEGLEMDLTGRPQRRKVSDVSVSQDHRCADSASASLWDVPHLGG